MRIGNLAGRATLFTDDGAVDVEKASEGLIASDPQGVFERWDELRAWAAEAGTGPAAPYDPAELGPPVPRPGQVFAVGLNYHSHAAEAGITEPGATPLVFTKFRSSLSGPVTTVTLPAGDVDWEAELVLVIGRRAHCVAAADAWDHVAGLAVGQDLSERTLQAAEPAPQFSLGKSYPGFAPFGPWVASTEEFADPDAVRLGCSLNGTTVQDASTADMIFPVPTIIEFLSAVAPLEPGDLVFTGTPGGVGLFQTPPRFLRHGDELVTWVDGVGELRQTFA